MKLLFVGESWMGSSARSLKEALQRITNSGIDEIDEINEDLYIPKARARWLRAIHRVLAPAYRRELAQGILKKCHDACPDILLVYKGNGVDSELIRAVKTMGIFTVNVFPDCSPHAHKKDLKKIIGEYDLVISTKPFHPALWNSVYGYSNRCIFVPHGYDPLVHLQSTPPTEFDFDLGLVATWRPEYHTLMCNIATLLASDRVSVAIAGNGWKDKAREFPDNWVFAGEVLGLCYVRWVRRSKILVAPVNRNILINGQQQPGDEDTTRTYELAAAHCFFIHRRTDFVRKVYDEITEVPLFDTAEELAEKIFYFLPLNEKRQQMAAAAHCRAVPAYSIDQRAAEIVSILQQLLVKQTP